jgi:hypothetical protein
MALKGSKTLKEALDAMGASYLQRHGNPFRPGAGHMPPYLAGRKEEEGTFKRLLEQDRILKNMILTGLRGVGKTVLLETLRPTAIQQGWGWVGTDLSESASITEERMATRILTDLAVYTAGLQVNLAPRPTTGFSQAPTPAAQGFLNHQLLLQVFNATPGLIADKLKNVLEQVWATMTLQNRPGIVFAYDEAQNLADHSEKEQFPLSLLLDVFQSIQRKGVRFLLVLTGLPTLFSQLVAARTYSERMFHTVFLSNLTRSESRDAIVIPIQQFPDSLSFSEESIETIIESSGGYPYFVQFICREVYDIWLQGDKRKIPMNEIIAKLDVDFFSGRWAKATNRQRDLLRIIALLGHCDTEFTVQEIVAASRNQAAKSFTSSHVNQMLVSLQNAGLVYKNRHGRYSFAVPLLAPFIRRQMEIDQELPGL